jgi:hypothetical protein
MRIRFASGAVDPAPAALSLEGALAEVRAQTGLDLAGARARLGFSRGHLLEIVVLSSVFTSGTDERALDAANLLLPLLLGEDVFDDWVGAVDVAPSPRGGSLRVLPDGATAPDTALGLADVQPAVRAAIRGVEAELPDVPYHARLGSADWTLLEAEPPISADYAALDDLVLLSTLVPEAMKCFLQGSPFSSRRFSRHGERFVYAKVDGGERTTEERYAIRVSIEEALDADLVRLGAGRVVGAGIGIRYVYVVLALARPDDGVAVARKTLKKLGVPRRAWIIPCDSACRHEWAGVFDDGLPPPAAE